ncbi:hypothetical protein SLEP1_g40875 [Rubroshorea leprosula]|uniref:Uncharacterized protein n=1 Tax=Rubroshorea leprosula TaxID=152421 RepID=A0AAV5L4V3_9ROSI|nr:hypothetical protein SLEP1_g40875 [Rubroshorea leprosula]
MVEIFRMYVEKSHTAKSKLKLPSLSDSQIAELQADPVFRASDNQNTWNCQYRQSPDGQHCLHVEQWDHFKGRINGRTISLYKEYDPYSQGAPSYKFEVQ